MGQAVNKAAFLLDTVILLDHLEGVAEATSFLASLAPRQAMISVLTRAELSSRAEPQDVALVLRLLDSWECVSLDRQAVDLAVQLAAEYALPMLTCWQLAIARVQRLILLTRPTPSFDPVSLECEDVDVPYCL